MSSPQFLQFISGLKSRNSETRMKTAKDLNLFVKTELREMSPEEINAFMDDINYHISAMVTGSDVNEKKGGVLAIECLLTLDLGNTSQKTSRFINYLRSLFPSSDEEVMELATRAVGKLAQISGTFTAEYVEFELKRAFEWLGGDRVESKRHAAVLVLRELSIAVPTYFFQQVQQFFDLIFNAVRDPKPITRETAVEAIRNALIVTAQRETAKQTQRPLWYKQCYDEAKLGLEEMFLREKGYIRDDRIHGSLLVLNELLRCANIRWERQQEELLLSLTPSPPKNTKHHSDFLGLIPRLKSPLLTTQKMNTVPSTIALCESSACRQLVTEKLDVICQDALAQSHSKSIYTQQALLSLLPRLAAFNRENFVRLHLSSCINCLLVSLRSREKERERAFTALGLVAVAVKEDIQPYLGRIMEIVRASLPVPRDSSGKKRGTTGPEPGVLACITLLGHAVPELVQEDLRQLMDAILATGLSPSLTTALRELATSVPSLKREISQGLLKMLSQVLMHEPLRHPGTPRQHQSPPQSFYNDSQDVANITLALRTLGSFNFEGHSLLQFVRRCADHFLTSETQELRLETVRTCSRLLRLALEGRKSPTVTATVADVLSKLLTVGITDTDAEVRYWVLESLDTSFDRHLAQAENLSALLVALNDEVFEIRELAVARIGRLSALNPAYVMPSLRKTLVQFLTELEHSGIGRNKEQSARMLDRLVVSAPRLVRPYMEPILKVLVPKLREPESNPAVLVNILTAIGDLAEVNGIVMQSWADELLPILMELLGEGSSPERRGVSLWCLGQLVGSAGLVITPYLKYPTLLDLLLNFLKTEQQPVIRRQTIRVLGALGALDPYRYKLNQGQIDTQAQSTPGFSGGRDNKSEELALEMTTSEMLVNFSTSNLEEFYPAVAIAALMRIIREPTHVEHTIVVGQAMAFIFKALGIKVVPYIGQVIPIFLSVIRTAEYALKEFLLQRLGELISIVKQHIRNYLDEIFLMIKEVWTPNSPFQVSLISLVESIAIALGAEFKVYLPQLLPHFLRVLSHDTSKDRIVTVNLLKCLQHLGNNLDDYLHLILPPVVRLFDSKDCPTAISKQALQTVEQLADTLNFTDFASRIIHPLVRALNQNPELRPAAMDTLCALVTQLGSKYAIFVPLVSKVITKHKIASIQYEVVCSRMLSGAALSEEDAAQIHRKKMIRQRNREATEAQSEAASRRVRCPISAEILQQSWAAGGRISKDDWLEWLRKLSLDLLKESPSPSLKACWPAAQNYSQLPRDLFNAAFVSCWTELSEKLQQEFLHSIEQALMVRDLPELTQIILNLAEFMDHCDGKSLPIDPVKLGERAMQCRAYAKALHYKEDEFHKMKEPNAQVYEALISINNKLQQKEAAAGLLEHILSRQGAEPLRDQERWYEKLHNWEKAKAAYEERLEENPQDIELTLGQMRCLEALGEWGQLHDVANKHWVDWSEDSRQRMARMAAAAAWGLNQWDSMERYVNCLPQDSQDGTFYRAVLAVHRDQFVEAQQAIDAARDLVDTELSALAGESYQRAYTAMVQVQMLSELEEVMQYKLVSERRPVIRQMWWQRLSGCQRVVEDWQKIIQVRTLVVSPQEDVHTWLKYASLCRKSNRLMLSKKTLVMLLGKDPSLEKDENMQLPTTNPTVTFAFTKHMWVAGQREQAFSQLQRLVSSCLRPQLQLGQNKQQDDHKRLLARCYLKLGQWQESLQGLSEKCIQQVLMYYAAATEHDPQWYKAWHAWSYMNCETVLFYKHQVQDTKSVMNKENFVYQYAVPAVEGFFRSIALSKGSSLQDTLRLLTLWFDYGQCTEVYEAIVRGLDSVGIDTWLQVIPQLIARIDSSRSLVLMLVHQLLIDIGKSHPQALVYPLTVASKSASAARRQAASKILKSMTEHSPVLVQQAVTVSDELIRVAILWHELWHEGLEEASRLYFGDRNVKGMLDTLEPLHAMVDRGPQTLKETSFNQTYGRDLMVAQEWCNRYKVSGNVRDLNQAWDLYYHVFRRIARQLPQLTSLELQYVSPKLLLCRDLELAVPGSYAPGQPIVRIAYIQPALQVIGSKQRPRKLCIKGSNGAEYMFLLKGHEDLRQDERVMQLFGLVNTLLLHDPDTFRRNLTIQRYAVIPLSTNSGLIGWVPHCDTLHTLIRDYREKKKILLNIEHRIMLRVCSPQSMAPDYDHLTLMQKVEVFENALVLTQGDDLARLLWLKSPSSEVWFDRRTNYTRSLAVMSMVGYILGLGDRHPSNVMLDRLSGKILHIDFGDCFEVAMTREKFPEKIPFRLTRMLINAMEVTGIEGTYRKTCESVLAVLRHNKDSLMAVLEAFVYDPLLNWRLMDSAPKDKRSKQTADASISSSAQEDGKDGDILVPSLPKKGIPIASSQDNGENNQPEALNKKALAIVTRVREKLTGRDFNSEETLEVSKQVSYLIQEATSNENLCQCYIGWCPFW